MLGAIRYQPNRATLHTDASLLPRNRRAWASWNYHRLDRPARRATLTYCLDRLQGIASAHEMLVTLNRDEAIDPTRCWPAWTTPTRSSTRRPSRPSGATGAQRHPAHLVLRRLLGLRLPRGRRPERVERLPALAGEDL